MNPVVALRAAVFVLIAGFMIGNPTLKQGFKVKGELPLGIEAKHLRAWVMFHGYGIGVCDAEYRQRLADGTEVELDRLAMMGHASRWEVPRPVRRLKDAEAAIRAGRALCRKLEDGPRDVRLYARCGHRKGWIPAADGEDNLCAPAAPAAGARP